MARLTAEQLNASARHDFDLDEQEVEVPQLGGTILLRELLLGERTKLEERAQKDGVSNAQALAMSFQAHCVEPRLKVAEVEKFLPKWPAAVADDVFKAINGLGGPDFEREESAAAEAEFPEPKESDGSEVPSG